MTSIEFSKVSKYFGKNQVLKDIDLKIEAGEFLVLVGPSGCGKSTLLRSLAGLETIDSGEIRINGKVVNQVEPQHRDISMVFQSYALYPHMNVFENMAFALQLQKMSKSETQKRVNEVAELLQISNLLERKPKDLSGGQRQRVALGRALTRNTPVILFDEPLSNLDAHLRNQMRLEIRKLHQQLKNTMIYVTHDQMEATTMGDRIAVMREGRIEQLASPTEIYHKPQDLFVARFIGSPEMNFLEGEVLKRLPFPNAQKPGMIMGARPEALKIAEGELKTGEIELGSMKVELSENLGGQQVIHGFLNASPIHVLLDSKVVIKPNQQVPLKIDLDQVHVFEKESGKNTRLS